MEPVKQSTKRNIFVCAKCYEKDKKAVGYDNTPFDPQFTSDCDICGEIGFVEYCPNYLKKDKH